MAHRPGALVTLVALVAAPAPVAATWTVDDDGPGDFSSIQAAINASASGDTILVRPGRYRETVTFLGKSVTVESTDGPAVTTVFLEGETRIVTLDSGGTIRGLTITGGRARVGGGIRVLGTGTQPVIEGNRIEGNVAEYDGIGLALGAGIAVQGTARPTIRNNVIRANSALGDAQGNFAYGGAIDLGDDTTATITNNVIEDNLATDTGGGISLGLAGAVAPVAITNNTIVGNRAGAAPNAFSFGGGISVYDGAEVVIRNNAITGNVAGFHGGGVYFKANNLQGIVYQANDFDGNSPEHCYGVSSNACTAGQLFLPPLYLDAAGGDYRLRSDSALIDRGSSTGVPPTDADGLPRQADGDLDGAALPDVGAFENQRELTRLRPTSDTALAWDGSANAAMTFDLYRDLLSGLVPGVAGDCFQSALTSPSATDPEAPPAGDGFLYLARGQDVAVGSLGKASDGSERQPSLACP